MSRAPRPPRYEVTAVPEVAQDVADLASCGSEVVEAALSIIDDLAHGRVRGKELGERHITGDLTGLARVKFDLPGQRPQRFRVLYRQRDEATREIIAIGPRDELAIYRAAVRRRAGDDPRSAGAG